MKTGILTLLFFAISMPSIAQIRYEKGYFIDLNNQKTECLIKNNDWVNNPYTFNYKRAEESEVQQADTSSIMEFGIYNFSKYIRADVKIDRSPKSLVDLSSVSTPLFSQERLYLRVLLEGAASLYYYKDKYVERYFYKIDGSAIDQLIYKEYLDVENNVRTNASFRQQLRTKVNCGNPSFNSINKMNYYMGDLKKYFTEYNECKGSIIVDYKNKKKYDFFNLKIAPEIGYATATISNEVLAPGYISSDNSLNFKLSLEAEFILPFNKRKWGVLVVPAYQYLNSPPYKNPTSSLSINKRSVEISYQTIELAIGLRHYFFLTDHSKFFINAFGIPGIMIDFDSKVIIGNNQELETNSSGNFAFGAGMEFKKISAEIRYNTKRNIVDHYVYWVSTYSSLSLIVGYKIF